MSKAPEKYDPLNNKSRDLSPTSFRIDKEKYKFPHRILGWDSIFEFVYGEVEYRIKGHTSIVLVLSRTKLLKQLTDIHPSLTLGRELKNVEISLVHMICVIPVKTPFGDKSEIRFSPDTVTFNVTMDETARENNYRTVFFDEN